MSQKIISISRTIVIADMRAGLFQDREPRLVGLRLRLGEINGFFCENHIVCLQFGIGQFSSSNTFLVDPISSDSSINVVLLINDIKKNQIL